MAIDWFARDRDMGQGDAYYGRLPQFYPKQYGSPAAPVSVTGAAPVSPAGVAGGPPNIPQAPTSVPKVGLWDMLQKRWFGTTAYDWNMQRETQKAALDEARRKLVSGIQTQNRLEGITQMQPGGEDRLQAMRDAVVRGDVEPAAFNALYPSSEVSPTSTAKLVKEIWGLDPGDPGFEQRAVSLIKLHNPGAESQTVWNTPIDPKERSSWVNEQGLNPPPGMSPIQATASGYGFQSQSDRDKVRAIADANRTLTTIDGMLFGDQGIYSGKNAQNFSMPQESIKSYMQSVIQVDPRYKEYEDYKRSTSAQIARLHEKGALTDDDVKRATALMPNVVPSMLNPIIDTPEVARRKLDQLNRLVGGDKSVHDEPIPGTEAPQQPTTPQTEEAIPPGTWVQGPDGVWYQK